MDKREVRIGGHYLCHESNFSWFFVGQAIAKKEKGVKVRVVKCHPTDRYIVNEDDPVLNIDYISIIEDA